MTSKKILKESEKRLFHKSLGLFKNNERDNDVVLTPSIEFLSIYIKKNHKRKSYLAKAENLYKKIQRFRHPKKNIYLSQENKIGASDKIKRIYSHFEHSLINRVLY